MMRIGVSFLCAVLLLCPCRDGSAGQEADSPVTFADVASAWKIRSESFKTLDVVYRKEHLIIAHTRVGKTIEGGHIFPKKDLTVTYELRFVLDGDQFRYEQAGDQWDNRLERVENLTRTVTFDGKDYRNLLAGDENTDEAYSFGAVMDSNLESMKDSAVRNPDVLPLVQAVRPLNSRFPTEMHQSWIVLPGRERIKNASCYALKAEVGVIEYRSWLDEDFRLLRWQAYINGNIVFQTDVTYDDRGNDRQIPTHWETAEYSTDTGELQQSFVATMQSLAVNEPVSSEKFTISYPEGAFVKLYPHAADGGKRYIVKDGKERVVTSRETARNPTYTQLLNSEPGQANLDNLERHSSRKMIVSIVTINVIVLLTLVILACMRRRRSADPH